MCEVKLTGFTNIIGIKYYIKTKIIQKKLYFKIKFVFLRLSKMFFVIFSYLE